MVSVVELSKKTQVDGLSQVDIICNCEQQIKVLKDKLDFAMSHPTEIERGLRSEIDKLCKSIQDFRKESTAYSEEINGLQVTLTNERQAHRSYVDSLKHAFAQTLDERVKESELHRKDALDYLSKWSECLELFHKEEDRCIVLQELVNNMNLQIHSLLDEQVGVR